MPELALGPDEAREDVDEVHDAAGLAGYMPVIPVGLAARLREAVAS